MEIIDKEIRINRGDRLLMEFSIDNKGTDYIFQEGDRLKFSIYEKKEWTSLQFCKKNLYLM